MKMKCVCGYEKRGKDWDDSDDKYKDRDPGNNDFLAIKGRMSLNFDNITTVKLYVCPKCGTVRAML